MAPVPKGTEAAVLVANAIKILHDQLGATAKNIAEHISLENDIPLSAAHRAVRETLQRGVAFGAITRNRNGMYQLTEFMNVARTTRKRKARNGRVQKPAKKKRKQMPPAAPSKPRRRKKAKPVKKIEDDDDF